MKEVRFHSAAAEEFEEAVAFYESSRHGLGAAFLESVEQVVARIAQHPPIGAVYKNTRFQHYVMRRFPYVIFYLETEEALWIVAVAHGKRCPGYWRHRNPSE